MLGLRPHQACRRSVAADDRRSGMKIRILLALLAVCTSLCQADERPVLSIYDVSPGDLLNPSPRTIFKLTNDTKKTFYILGLDISDVKFRGQTFNGKSWKDDEILGLCGTGSSFFPLKPGAYLLFCAWGPHERDVPWRIRAWIYGARDPSATPLEILSPEVIVKENTREEY
jgi:hypothetical protein